MIQQQNTSYSNSAPFKESEIERIEWMISNIRNKGTLALHEFDINRGIDKEKALIILNNQLNYFRTK